MKRNALKVTVLAAVVATIGFSFTACPNNTEEEYTGIVPQELLGTWNGEKDRTRYFTFYPDTVFISGYSGSPRLYKVTNVVKLSGNPVGSTDPSYPDGYMLANPAAGVALLQPVLLSSDRKSFSDGLDIFIKQ